VTLLYIIIILLGNPLVLAQLTQNIQKVWVITKGFPNSITKLFLSQ